MRKVISISALALMVAGSAFGQVRNFGNNPQHTGIYTAPAVNVNQVLWTKTIDRHPASFGHYGAPLVTSANTVIQPVKTETDGFEVQAYDSTGADLYTLATDYILPSYSWVPVYQPTLTSGNFGTRLYYPGAGGTVFQYDNADSAIGVPVRLCFYTDIASYTAGAAGYNSTVFINTPITSDSNGNIFFGFRVQGSAPAPLNTTQSGFAKIDANGTGSYVLISDVSGDANLNKTAHSSAPTLSNDEHTLYVYARGNSDAYAYLLALDANNLSLKQKVRLMDPRNNGNGARVIDQSTASVMVAPDGDVYCPVFANPYNGSRGFMLRFNSDLSVQKTPGAFGWDFTPGLVPASMVPSYTGTSSYLLFCKYNNYAITDGDGINRVALLDPNAIQVDFHATAPGLVVMREVLTAISPAPDSGFPSFPGAVREWCINAAAVNPATNSILFNCEDGFLYRWDVANNVLGQAVRLNEGIGQPYVPTVVGPDGAVYNLNGGYMFKIGGYDGGVSYTVTSSKADMRKALASDSLTFTAKVNGGVGAPSGTFDFEAVTHDGFTEQHIPLATGVAVDGSGQASVTTTALLADSTHLGNHLIVATYSGDAGHAAGAGQMLQKVHQYGTTTTLSTNGPTNYGDSVVLTANVASSGGTATGYVTFKKGALPIGQVYLNGGQAQFTVSGPNVGSHTYSAEYMSDTWNAYSSGNAFHTVTAATSVTSASTSPNPSTFGQQVTLSATVAAVNSSAGVPTGSVTFKEGSTVLGTGTLNAGNASATISTLSVGSHAITAVFTGTGGWQNSSASAGTQSVTSSTSTAISGSPNPSSFGQSVTFTATVTSSSLSNGTPTGSVVFTVDGTPGSAVTVDGQGKATFSTSALGVGSHTVSAAFTGTGGWQNSASGNASQSVTSTTSTALGSSLNPSNGGQNVTFTATVTTGIAGAGTPTGSVEFKDGATTLGTVAVNGSGVATLSTSSLSAGSHSISANFTGTGGWQNSNALISQQVNDVVAPTVPTNVVAVSGPAAGQVKLTWTASTDAHSSVHHYEVWRGTKATGTFTLIASPTGTTYTDNAGKNQKRFYYIIAVDAFGNKSAKSATVQATGLRAMVLVPETWL